MLEICGMSHCNSSSSKRGSSGNAGGKGLKLGPNDSRSLSSETGYPSDNRSKSSPKEEDSVRVKEEDSVRVSVTSKMGLLSPSLSEESEDRSIDCKEGSNGLTLIWEAEPE